MESSFGTAAAAAGKIRIKLESETSAELELDVKGTDKVENIIKIIKKAWGDKDDFITIYHQGIVMREDQILSDYNLINGSVLKVKVSADCL